MNDTFERYSNLSIDDDSVNSGRKQKGNFTLDLKENRNNAKQMANAFDMFGKGDPAPKNGNPRMRETYSELADEDEKDAVFNHSM